KEDITQSKKDQSEISRMANILEATPDLVGMAYPNGDVFYLNRGGRLLMQIPASEDITKLNIREFHPEEISLLITQKGLPIAKDRGYWSAETRILTRTGEEIPVLQNIISHKNYENVVTHYSTIIRDIREIKKMEENLMDAKEKAEQSDKLKTEFLAQMSHEIRSPMNAVISFATLLKVDLSKDLSPEHLEYFAGIDSAGRRLIRTVELILNASELQVGTYKPDFSDMGLIGEILTRISSEYKLLAEEKGLTFNFRSNIEEAVIEGDKESIYQVFVNLMDNAVKYTQKGSVSINVEQNEDAQEVKVTIEDSGIGISQEFLDQMFEPFTQEDRGYSRRYDGNGLGLSLVKKYCELNGITIEVESKKEIGSKFTLIFACKK
ncbi:MAG: HAMP domain-containing sensor histidine kinase, partial [Ignavibacteria bacterium]|nr:HAMP domain-containing sensor histidine kinase [Ignavibacteria bacterium]